MSHPFRPSGNYRRGGLSAVLLILFLGIMTGASGTSLPAFPSRAAAQDDISSARGLVFEREWKNAILRFKEYLNGHPSGKFREESLYWMSFCMNQEADREMPGTEKTALKKEALETLRGLSEKYPGGHWTDDAEILSIAISRDLALSGETGFKAGIEALARQCDPSRSRQRMVALAAMFDLDIETAVSIVAGWIDTEKNAGIRKSAVFLLGQSGSDRAARLLGSIQRKDPDREIRREAYDWLIRNRSMTIIRFAVYEALASDGTDRKLFPESTPFSFDLPLDGSFDAERREELIESFFKGAVGNLKPLEKDGEITFPFPDLEDGVFELTAKTPGPIRFSLSGTTASSSPDRIGISVGFDIESAKLSRDISFELVRGTGRLVGIRRGRQVLILYMFFEPPQPPPGKYPDPLPRSLQPAPSR